jgi:hypothetical protein
MSTIWSSGGLEKIVLPASTASNHPPLSRKKAKGITFHAADQFARKPMYKPFHLANVNPCLNYKCVPNQRLVKSSRATS